MAKDIKPFRLCNRQLAMRGLIDGAVRALRATVNQTIISAFIIAKLEGFLIL